MLSVFAPDPPSRPYVTPLYPPLDPSAHAQLQYDPSSRLRSLPPQTFPTSINFPLDYSPPNISIPQNVHEGSSKRRHWVIARNLSRRGKEKDDDSEMPEVPDFQSLREVHAADFGSFAPLAGALEEEMRQRGIMSQEGDDEAKTFEVLRESLDCEATANRDDLAPESAGVGAGDYWSTQRAAAAEEYIRDLVYGGVDGLAYTRSLAEFLTFEQEPVSLVSAFTVTDH